MTDHPDEAAALLDFLRLQIEWGADEALLDEPVDRRAPMAAAPAADADRRPAADRGHAPVVAVERARPPPRTVPEPAFRGGHGAAEAARLAAAAPDLVALAAAVAAFSLSSLRDTAGALAFADGPARARLMVVADAPSAADDESGRPLSGREGDLLDRMLASIGIARADTRVGCLVPWRAAGRPAADADRDRDAAAVPRGASPPRLPRQAVAAGPGDGAGGRRRQRHDASARRFLARGDGRGRPCRNTGPDPAAAGDAASRAPSEADRVVGPAQPRGAPRGDRLITIPCFCSAVKNRIVALTVPPSEAGRRELSR